jgi:hypothetical protein
MPRDQQDRSELAWAPSLSCATWNDAHRTARAMHQGGVLLRTTTPPPVGSGVHLTLRFPDGTEVVLVGDVLDSRDTEGAVVRFRVATPILTQLESRAFTEERGAPRPGRPLARGSQVPEEMNLSPRPEPEPPDPESGTTYSIHRRKKK